MSEFKDSVNGLIDHLQSIKGFVVDIRRDIHQMERSGTAPSKEELRLLSNLGVESVKVRNLLNNVLIPMLNESAGRQKLDDVYTPTCPPRCKCQQCSRGSAPIS